MACATTITEVPAPRGRPARRGNGPVSRAQPAFTLVELVLVIAILGVLAAIAIPRLSRGRSGAVRAALRQDIVLLQRQIELYAAEHGSTYPAYRGDGVHAAHTEDAFLGQMLSHSNLAGVVNDAGGPGYPFGPYLEDIPPLKAGAHAGDTGIKVFTGGDTLTYQPGEGVGWLYHDVTGRIVANVPALVGADDDITDATKLEDVGGPAKGGPADVGP